MLGVGDKATEETLTVGPLPDVVAARERQAERAEQASALAGVMGAIREKIEQQPPEPQGQPITKTHRARNGRLCCKLPARTQQSPWLGRWARSSCLGLQSSADELDSLSQG